MLWFFTSDSYDIPLPPPTYYIVLTVNHSRFFPYKSTHANCVLAGPCRLWILKSEFIRDFSGGLVVMNPPSNAGDTGLIPGLGRSVVLRGNWGNLAPRATATGPERGVYWARAPQSPRSATGAPRQWEAATGKRPDQPWRSSAAKSE